MIVVSVKSFNKDISKIRDKKLAGRLEEVIRKIESSDSLSEIPNLKKMAGASNAYRIRIGDYRLGFYLINNTVQLTVFADRKEIYRHFP